jgi:hypothetical protein
MWLLANAFALLKNAGEMGISVSSSDSPNDGRENEATKKGGFTRLIFITLSLWLCTM